MKTLIRTFTTKTLRYVLNVRYCGAFSFYACQPTIRNKPPPLNSIMKINGMFFLYLAIAEDYDSAWPYTILS